MYGVRIVNKAPEVGSEGSLLPLRRPARRFFPSEWTVYIRPKRSRLRKYRISITEGQKSSHGCRTRKERINHFQTCPINKISISRNRANCPYSTFVSETVNVASSSLCKGNRTSSPSAAPLYQSAFITSVTRFHLRVLFGPATWISIELGNRNGAR